MTNNITTSDMASNDSVFEARGRILSGILKGRGLGPETVLSDFMRDPDAATTLFVSHLPGYPDNRDEMEKMYTFTAMCMKDHPLNSGRGGHAVNG